MVSNNSPIDVKETLDVTANIENIGANRGVETIDLEVDSIERDSEVLELSGKESKDLTLSWNTSPGDAGDYTAVISSENDSVSMPVTVEQLTSWVDNFEDGDVSEYDDPNNVLSAQQNIVAEGSYAGEWLNQTGSSQVVFGTGLSNTPSRGDVVQYQYQPSSNPRNSFVVSFAAQDSSTGYVVQHNPGGQSLNLLKLVNGSVNKNDVFAWDIPEDTWHLMEIRFGDPSIEVAAPNASGNGYNGPASFDDTDWDNGDWGYYSATNCQAYIDDVKITGSI